MEPDCQEQLSLCARSFQFPKSATDMLEEGGLLAALRPVVVFAISH